MPSFEQLTQILTDADQISIFRRDAAADLGDLGDASAIPILIGALEDASALVRREAARSLGKLNAPKAASPLLLALAHEIDEATRRIIVEALDKDASFLNGLVLQANVVSPNGDALPVQFMQTAPGEYEAEFPVDQTGQYIASVDVQQWNQENARHERIGFIDTGVAIPFSPEFRELTTNEALLRRVANITDGDVLAMDPQIDAVFSHDLPPTTARRQAWDWTVAWLLLPLFLLLLLISA